MTNKGWAKVGSIELKQNYSLNSFFGWKDSSSQNYLGLIIDNKQQKERPELNSFKEQTKSTHENARNNTKRKQHQNL